MVRHVLREKDNDWVKRCVEYEVEGAGLGGGLRRLGEIVEKDCWARGLDREDAMDCSDDHLAPPSPTFGHASEAR